MVAVAVTFINILPCTILLLLPVLHGYFSYPFLRYVLALDRYTEHSCLLVPSLRKPSTVPLVLYIVAAFTYPLLPLFVWRVLSADGWALITLHKQLSMVIWRHLLFVAVLRLEGAIQGARSSLPWLTLRASRDKAATNHVTCQSIIVNICTSNCYSEFKLSFRL